MALVTQCDFCGKTYPFNPSFTGTTIVEIKMPRDHHYDMCAECEYKLKEFMSTLKKEKEK